VKIKIIGCAALALVLVASGPVLAEQLMRLSPEMRLSRGTSDKGESSQNVTVSPLNGVDLPDFIRERVKGLLLMCAGDADQLGNVRAYAWSGDRHANENLSPNYVVDFSAVKIKADVSSCGQTPICNAEGCLLSGYTPVDATTWKQDFELRNMKLDFVTIPGTDTSSSQTQIQTLSNKRDCAESGGAKTDGGCLRRFIWRNFGLKAVPLS
jgi:hypothetical protein